MKFDLSNFKSKYYGARIKYVGDFNEMSEIFNVLNNANDNPEDCPDGYYKDDKTVYIFEHFEFDSYKNRSDGSEFKKQEAESKRTIFNTISNTSFHYHVSPTENDYKNNFIKTFKKHYNRISEYKKNLINNFHDEDLKFKTIFVIEDTTMFGSGFYVNDEYNPLFPVFFSDIKDLIRNCANIDYYIFGLAGEFEKLILYGKNFDDERIYTMTGNERFFVMNNYLDVAVVVPFKINK